MIAVAGLLLPPPQVILYQPEAERRCLPYEVCIFISGGVLRARERIQSKSNHLLRSEARRSDA